jgi:hypothetical protein
MRRLFVLLAALALLLSIGMTATLASPYTCPGGQIAVNDHGSWSCHTASGADTGANGGSQGSSSGGASGPGNSGK